MKKKYIIGGNVSTVSQFGVVLIISLVLTVLLFVSTHYECLNNYTSGGMCGFGSSLLLFFLFLPLGLIGSLGVIISAMMKKNRRINFSRLDKFFTVISILSLAVIVLFVCYILWDMV
jgi:uncharacterized membrane protein